MSVKLFFEALNKGCTVAQNVFDLYLECLAIGIKSLISVFDPDMIVLSGDLINAGEAFLNPLKEKLNTEIAVEFSSLKSDAGIVGAAMLQWFDKKAFTIIHNYHAYTCRCDYAIGIDEDKFDIKHN